MVDIKDVKLQIIEYHKLREELRPENIDLPKQFVARLLIKKLLDLWSDYKQQLKHKQKAAKEKQMTKANFVQTNPKRYNHKVQNSDNKPKIANPYTFEKKGSCYVCGKPKHHAPQCRNR